MVIEFFKHAEPTKGTVLLPDPAYIRTEGYGSNLWPGVHRITMDDNEEPVITSVVVRDNTYMISNTYLDEALPHDFKEITASDYMVYMSKVIGRLEDEIGAIAEAEGKEGE